MRPIIERRELIGCIAALISRAPALISEVPPLIAEIRAVYRAGQSMQQSGLGDASLVVVVWWIIGQLHRNG